MWQLLKLVPRYGKAGVLAGIAFKGNLCSDTPKTIYIVEYKSKIENLFRILTFLMP